LVSFAALAAFLLAGAVVAGEAAGATLAGSGWTLHSLRGSAVEGGPRVAHLVFTEDRVSGSTGCNRLSGTYQLDDQALSFGPIAATRMACKGEAMALERAFLDMLAAVAGWRESAGHLELLAADGGVLAVFEAGAPQ
jgi:heat shock protein HslJ